MTESPANLPESHLDAHEVVAYLEHRLRPAERAQIESHLAGCEKCTNEIAEVWRLSRPGAKRTPWLPIGVAAAAAIAALALLRPAGRQTRAADEDLLRGTERAGAVIIVAPAESVIVHDHPVLVWHAVPGATGYRVTVSREDGDSIWTGSTSDTVARVPAGVALARSAKYFWYVDALLSDGQSLTSGVHEFKTGP